MIYKTTLLNIVILLIIIGCSNSNQNDKSSGEEPVSEHETTAVDSNIIKVYVEEDGTIMANGTEISLNNLDSSFSKLKKTNGTVYYSRANRQGDPPEESMKVMELIVEYSLPVKLFTDKTFTVVVKPN